MTQRERKLAVIFGGGVALLAVWIFVRGALLDPIWKARDEVASLRSEEGALQARVKMEALYKRQWNDIRLKTLPGDPYIAQSQLDVMIKKLMVDAGFIHVSVNLSPPREEKRTWPGLYIIPYTVNAADGDLQAFAKFLHAFYQQPYLMQIHSFILEQPPMTRGKPFLHVSGLQIEAISLSSEGMPLPAATTHPGDPKAPPLAKPWRPADPDVDAYAVLWTRRWMEPFSAATPPQQAAPGPGVAAVILSPSGGPITNPIDVKMTCSTPGAAIRYTTDGSNPTATTGNLYDNNPVHVTGPLTIKAVAYKEGIKDSPLAVATYGPPPTPPLRLIGLYTYTPVAEAEFLNEQTKERIYVREGDSFEGGRLLLVLPEAAVVEMPDGPRFVYWLGKPVKEKEQLDPVRQPDVAAAVEILVESR
jgi:hypothetical protein